MILAKRFFRAAPTVDVVELGTSVGVVGSRLVRRLAPGRRYVGLEMQAWAAAVGERTIRRHAPKGVSVDVFWGAVCSAHDMVGVYAPGPIATAGAMRGTAVPSVTLGELLERAGVTGDYVLMMDIEGSESDVFANDTAALGGCQAVVVELHDCIPTDTNPWGCAATQALSMIAALGFRARARVGAAYYLERESSRGT